MKREISSVELNKIINFDSQEDTQKKTFKILKENLIEFGLELVKEGASHTGTKEIKFKYRHDWAWKNCDEDNRTREYFTNEPPVETLSASGGSSSLENVLYYEPWGVRRNQKLMLLGRDVKEYCVLHDKRTGVYLYLEFCLVQEYGYRIWYDLFIDYDVAKPYESQSDGACLSQAIPHMKWNPFAKHQMEWVTGSWVISTYKCFDRILTKDDDIIITYNKGFFSMAFVRRGRKFLAQTSNFVYISKVNYYREKKSMSSLVGRLLAMKNNWCDDKSRRFWYNMGDGDKYFNYYKIPFPILPGTATLTRFITRNRLYFSFYPQVDEMYNYGAEYKNVNFPDYNEYIKDESLNSENYNNAVWGKDTTLFDSLENTQTKFPFVVYLGRQPRVTETISPLLETQCYSLMNATGYSNFEDIVEETENHLAKYSIIGKWNQGSHVVHLVEYFRKTTLFAGGLKKGNSIRLTDEILDFDRVEIFVGNKKHELNPDDFMDGEITLEGIEIKLITDTVLEVSDIKKIKKIVGYRG